MSTITARLSGFVADFSFEGMPEGVTERAKLLVMDILGIALRARHDAESTPSLLAAVDSLGLGRGQSTVVGDEAGFAPPGAALINGTLAHSLDFDDTHAGGSIHASAPIVPAALAAAEMTGGDGRTLIAGIVAGYEVQIRLSMALGPKDHYDRGYHPTATCGAFGAAAAAARVFGLSAGQVANAFGICLSQAAGSMAFLVDGAWTKRYQVGHAAMNGLIAASLAREGFTGPAEPLAGKAGFLRSYAPNPMVEKAMEGLGEVYETLAIGVKPYPSCRYSHAGMEALIALRRAHQIEPEEIESVEIGLSHTGWDIIGDPEVDKHHPKNIVDGQFSMPFLAAVVLREGGMAWEDYTRHIGNDATLRLCRLVSTVVEPNAETAFASPMGARAQVRTKRGTFDTLVAIAKGEPEAFLTADELRAKFDGLVGPYLPAARLDDLAAALLSLETANDIGEVLRLTRSGSTVPLTVAAGKG